MQNTKRIITVIVLILHSLASYSQEKADNEFKFRFINGKDMFFSPYQNNETEMNRLLACIDLYRENILQNKIYVDGYCNLRGSQKKVLKIAKIRSNRVKSELITRKGLTEICFITHCYVTKDKDDVVIVRIGIPYNTASAKIQENQESQVIQPDTIPTPTAVEKPQQDTVVVKIPQPVTAEPIADTIAPPTVRNRLALRANLLRWLTLTPDLGVEWYFANHWSAAVNGSFTSLKWDDSNRRYALWEVAPEIRYYFADWQCLYVGAQAKFGEFNHKWSDTGKQGSLAGGGILLGYLLPMGKTQHFGIDFKIGAGCLHADYETYYLTDGIRIKESDCTKDVWGLTDVGISLIWKFK